MATTLYLRDSVDSGIGSFRDLLSTAGASSTTGVVNTSASGTQIQWTKTAGGAALEWISGRSPAGGWTLSGVVSFFIQAQESNMNANVGGRVRLFKRTAAGGETEIGGGPWDDGVEFGTNAGQMTWTGTPTSTSFTEDDRLIVRFYITNVGTMAGGYTATITYDNGSSNTSGITLTETVAFKPEPSDVTLTQSSTFGNSATTYAATVTPGAVTLAQDNRLAGDQGFPAITVTLGGAPQTLTQGARVDDNPSFYALDVLQVLTPPRLEPSEGFYTSVLTTTSFSVQVSWVVFDVLAADAQNMLPARYDNTVVFHTHTLTPGAIDLLPARYDNDNGFYSVTLTSGYGLLPTRYDNSNSFYTPTVTAGGVGLTATRYDNDNGFYAPVVSSGGIALTVARYDNSNSFYTPTVTPGNIALQPARYDNSNSFYSPMVTLLLADTLYPELVLNEQVFFAHVLTGGEQAANDGYYVIRRDRR